jgi:hypothetical protein
MIELKAPPSFRRNFTLSLSNINTMDLVQTVRKEGSR